MPSLFPWEHQQNATEAKETKYFFLKGKSSLTSLYNNSEKNEMNTKKNRTNHFFYYYTLEYSSI